MTIFLVFRNEVLITFEFNELSGAVINNALQRR